MGRIASFAVTLAVPDPDGARIGSGAATLNAISALSNYYRNLEVTAQVENAKNSRSQSSISNRMLNNEGNPQSMINLTNKHVLLLHAGGDSKRVPWANPMGKVFLPLPYLAADDPDGPVPLLFDHILAISSCARQAFKNKGGLFTMTGDVLPCFNASAMVFPDDSSCIITVPIILDVASNHGVIVASKTGTANGDCLVENLLQKPSLKELVEKQSILQDGRTLLVTGVIVVRGKAWVDLLMLANSSQTMISELLKQRKESSYHS